MIHDPAELSIYNISIRADWTNNKVKRGVDFLNLKNLNGSQIDKNLLSLVLNNASLSGLDFWNQTKNFLEPILDKNGTYSTVRIFIFSLNTNKYLFNFLH